MATERLSYQLQIRLSQDESGPIRRRQADQLIVAEIHGRASLGINPFALDVSQYGPQGEEPLDTLSLFTLAIFALRRVAKDSNRLDLGRAAKTALDRMGEELPFVQNIG